MVAGVGKIALKSKIKSNNNIKNTKVMYKKVKYSKSTIQSIEKLEGEPIEHKIERILNNKEPIKDGAPEIFTERKEGVVAAYNIRTDRFEIAAETMDKIHASKEAKRDAKPSKKETTETTEKEVKVVDINGVKPTQGTKQQGD